MKHKIEMRRLACICGATIAAPTPAFFAWDYWSKTHRGTGLAQGVRAAIAREARQQEATQ